MSDSNRRLEISGRAHASLAQRTKLENRICRIRRIEPTHHSLRVLHSSSGLARIPSVEPVRAQPSVLDLTPVAIRACKLQFLYALGLRRLAFFSL